MTSAVRIRQLETLFIDKLQEKYKLTERDLKRAFAFYDTDKNGILDVAELLACISTYLNGVSRQEVQSLVDCYDVNGDGKISYEEFYEMLTTRSATENAQTGNGSNNNQKSRGAPAPSRGGSRSNNVPDHYSVDDMSLDSARFRGDNFSNNYNDGYRRSQQQQQLERVKQYEDTQYDRHRVPDNNSRYMPPAPPSQSDLSSVVDLNNEAELSARATSYLSNLKIMLTTQANAAKARIRTADRLSMHQTELVATISKDIIYKAFQPFIHEGSFDSMSGGRRYGRPPMGVSMAEFIKVLRQFTKTGASVINVDVAKHVWAMCMEYSSSGSSELLEPDALFHLLFHKDPNNNGGPSNNHIVRGGILPLDSVQATHPETVGDSFKSGLIQQQALMLPPPPPGSFKKIIAHPTRTLLTVPANFEPDLVNASARLPKYECVMYVFSLFSYFLIFFFLFFCVFGRLCLYYVLNICIL